MYKRLDQNVCLNAAFTHLRLFQAWAHTKKTNDFAIWELRGRSLYAG